VRLSINVDMETAGRLCESAVIERRSAEMQAEILIRRACGLPDPLPEWAKSDAVEQGMLAVAAE
jgi:hypothetical protein